MTQFRLSATQAFSLDGRRYDAGDILGVEALCIARDLLWRKLVVSAPIKVDGANGKAERAVATTP